MRCNCPRIPRDFLVSGSSTDNKKNKHFEVGRIYRLQVPLPSTSATNADWLKDASHIRPPGVQTPDTERVSAQSGQRKRDGVQTPDTERVSAQSGQKGEKGERGSGENSRDLVCLKAL